MAQMSLWCKDGRRRFLSFLGSFVNECSARRAGGLGTDDKEEKQLPCDGRSLYPVLITWGLDLQCSGGKG